MKQSKYNKMNWDKWLKGVCILLSKNGYKKIISNDKGQDFIYYKVISNDANESLYQIEVYFYDYRKYPNNDKISIMYECILLLIDGRIDLKVSKENFNFLDFEIMGKEFYNSMKRFN